MCFTFFLLVLLRLSLSLTQCCTCLNSTTHNFTRNGCKEVLIFVSECNRTIWEKFDWNKITTIALVNFTDPELICFAHKRKVSVVFRSSFETKLLLNETSKNQWIQENVMFASNNCLDGINLNYQEPLEKESQLVISLNNLVSKTHKAFHKIIPGSRVSFNVPWSPYNDPGNGVDGRNYDFVTLSNNTDFLYIMSYDIQSQMFYSKKRRRRSEDDNECYARANSGLFDSAGGLLAYKKLGISGDKLILGQPWYGYDYECLTYNDYGQCAIKHVPFRGANCSDKVANSLSYAAVMNLLSEKGGDQFYDPHSRTPFVRYIDKQTNFTHQVWFDNNDSLYHKYVYANQFNLRGIGVWNANYLNYSDIKQVRDMWSAIPGYNSTLCKVKVC